MSASVEVHLHVEVAAAGARWRCALYRLHVVVGLGVVVTMVHAADDDRVDGRTTNLRRRRRDAVHDRVGVDEMCPVRLRTNTTLGNAQ